MSLFFNFLIYHLRYWQVHQQFHTFDRLGLLHLLRTVKTSYKTLQSSVFLLENRNKDNCRPLQNFLLSYLIIRRTDLHAAKLWECLVVPFSGLLSIFYLYNIIPEFFLKSQVILKKISFNLPEEGKVEPLLLENSFIFPSVI